MCLEWAGCHRAGGGAGAHNSTLHSPNFLDALNANERASDLEAVVPKTVARRRDWQLRLLIKKKKETLPLLTAFVSTKFSRQENICAARQINV